MVVLQQEYRSTTIEVINLVKTITHAMSRKEIQSMMGLKHEGNFRDNYLLPALKLGLIEMTHPMRPNHPKQHYRLTAQGLKLKQELGNE